MLIIRDLKSNLISVWGACGRKFESCHPDYRQSINNRWVIDAFFIETRMKEDPRHIHISEYNYPLPDERIAKFPLTVRDQSKLLVYRHGEVTEDVFTSLPDYLPKGSLMVFNNTKVIQARLHFRKETGALIEVFCLEPIQPNDYVLNFQQTEHAAWLCMIGNLKKWKDGALKREMTVKGFTITLTATRGECRGTSHWIDFSWNNPEVTFADILEVFGELPIPPYLNRDTEESDKETYQTVYSKIKGSVAAPTAGLHFTPRVLEALIEVFCLEPIQPNDYVLNFQQTEHAAWLCMIGNLKKWKDGALKREMTVKGFTITLTATRGECRGTSHWIDFSWNNPEVTFADILEVFGELPIPPYLNRDTEESDKETYQTVYSKIKGSVAAPTAGLHFTPRVLEALQEKGIDLEELTLHVGAGTFKPVKSEEIEGHEMHTEYISVNRATIKKLIDHDGCAVAVGTTSVRTLESLYHIGVTLAENPDATEEELHVRQWQPYEKYDQIPPVVALQKILGYLDRNGLEALHSSTQIIIAPGYQYKIVKAMVTNFHQPQSTLLLLVSAFVKGNWRTIYDYALSHDFRFLSYGDSSLLIP